MPAKVNCASAWANHTAGRSAQNGHSGYLCWCCAVRSAEDVLVRVVLFLLFASGTLFALLILQLRYVLLKEVFYSTAVHYLCCIAGVTNMWGC
jgi:hypothetical protein